MGEKKGFIKLLYGMIYTRLHKQGFPINPEVLKPHPDMSAVCTKTWLAEDNIEHNSLNILDLVMEMLSKYLVFTSSP